MKPHYRLHVNLGDAKPLWWVYRVTVIPGKRIHTAGYSTARAAIEAASEWL